VVLGGGDDHGGGGGGAARMEEALGHGWGMSTRVEVV
jgi:hypothetical protein